MHVVPPLSTATSTATATEAEAFAQRDSSEDSSEEACSERVGYLLRGSPVRIVAPGEFLDPVTDCLILEPVTLLNTGTTLDRLTLQQWLRAGACPALSSVAACFAVKILFDAPDVARCARIFSPPALCLHGEQGLPSVHSSDYSSSKKEL